MKRMAERNAQPSGTDRVCLNEFSSLRKEEENKGRDFPFAKRDKQIFQFGGRKL